MPLKYSNNAQYFCLTKTPKNASKITVQTQFRGPYLQTVEMGNLIVKMGKNFNFHRVLSVKITIFSFLLISQNYFWLA